jgi:peroxiredoxin
LAGHFDNFEKKQSDLIIIGSGSCSDIAEFKKITGYKGKILTDPSRATFGQLGLTSGIGGLLGLKTLSRGFSALRQGIKPGTLQGSALQLGGAVIIDKKGSVLYQFRSREAGEDPPVEEMLAAIV